MSGMTINCHKTRTVLHYAWHRSARWTCNDFELPREQKNGCTACILSAAQTLLVVPNDTKLWKVKMVYRMAWPTALSKRNHDHSKLGKELFRNVRDDVQLGDAANARVAHHLQTNISSRCVRTYGINPITLVREYTVRKHENIYKDFLWSAWEPARTHYGHQTPLEMTLELG